MGLPTPHITLNHGKYNNRSQPGRDIPAYHEVSGHRVSSEPVEQVNEATELIASTGDTVRALFLDMLIVKTHCVVRARTVLAIVRARSPAGSKANF
jgi:hypothetical protein